MAGFCLRFVQNTSLQCTRCGQHFSSVKSLIKHLRSLGKHESHGHHVQGGYSCTACNKEFNDHESLIQHLKHKKIHLRDLHSAACHGTMKELMKAVKCGRKILNMTGCSHEPDKNNNQHVGFTPLHCAVINDRYHLMQQLLENGADPNVQNEYGDTPLHCATKRGSFEMVSKLLRFGGNLFLRNSSQESPLSIATDSIKFKLCGEMFKKVVVDSDKIYLEDFKCTRTSLRFMEHAKASSNLKPSFSRLSSLQDEESEGTSRKRHRSAPERLLPQRNEGVQDTIEKDKSAVATVSEEVAKTSRQGNDEVALVQKTDLLSVQCTDDSDALSCSTISVSEIPLEVIAGSEMAVEAFKNAMAEGMEAGRHLKLVILGDVGAGKTSLARTLSGTEFVPEREETKGISTHIVNAIELDSAWMVTDSDYRVNEACVSHAAHMLAEFVRKHLEDHPGQNILPYVAQTATKEPCGQVVSLPMGWPTSCLLPKQKIQERLMSELLENVPEKLDEDLKITIWDFAGHNLYQHMHHLFLNDRCLYLAVFNLLEFKERKEKTLAGLRYWMNSIAVHTTREVPLVIVGTNKDSVEDDVIDNAGKELRRLFFEKFGNYLVMDARNGNIFFPIDNAKGPRSDEAKALRSAIKEEAKELPYVRNRLPIKWIKCEEAILKQQQFEGHPSIQEKKELKKNLTEQAGEMTDEEFEEMLQYFHDIALIILPEKLPSYDNQDMVDDQVILNPQELVDALARVCDLETDALNNRALRKQGLKFGKEDVVDETTLKTLWKEIKIPENIILALLKAFNMLLPYQGSDDSRSCVPYTSTPMKHNVSPSGRKFLVPCHVKEEDIRTLWLEKICDNAADEYCFCIDFPDFVPEAVFHHLLVRLALTSKERRGFPPVLKRSMGIFCFGVEYKFMLRFKREQTQIHGYLSPDFKGDPCGLLHTIEDELSKIAKLFFRNLVFSVGLVCPLSPCVEEDTTDGNCGHEERKMHCVPLCLLNQTFYYCDHKRQRIDSHTEIMKWLTPKLDESQLEYQLSVDSGCSDSFSSCNKEWTPAIMQAVGHKLGPSYKPLGASLGLDDSDLCNIEMLTENSQNERGYEVLRKWRQKVGKEASVENLKFHLVCIERKDIVDDLPETFCDSRCNSGSFG